MTKYLKKVLH